MEIVVFKALFGKQLEEDDDRYEIHFDITSEHTLPLEGVSLAVGSEQKFHLLVPLKERGGKAKHFWAIARPLPPQTVFRLQLGS